MWLPLPPAAPPAGCGSGRDGRRRANTVLLGTCEQARRIGVFAIPFFEPQERPALLGDERFYVPPYFRPAGWSGLELPVASVDWEEVGELMDSSYRQVALKRMLRALDDDT